MDEATASMRGEMADMLAELKKTVADNSEATAQLQEASSNNFTNVQKQFGAAADSVDVATGAVCVEMRRLHSLHSAPTTFAPSVLALLGKLKLH